MVETKKATKVQNQLSSAGPESKVQNHPEAYSGHQAMLENISI